MITLCFTAETILCTFFYHNLFHYVEYPSGVQLLRLQDLPVLLNYISVSLVLANISEDSWGT